MSQANADLQLIDYLRRMKGNATVSPQPGTKTAPFNSRINAEPGASPMRPVGDIMRAAEYSRSMAPAPAPVAPTPAPAPQAAPAPQKGSANPVDTNGRRTLADIEFQRRQVMQGFRNLGPEYGQNPAQAAERMRLADLRHQLDTQGKALSGVLNPPAPVMSAEQVAASRAHLQAQFDKNVGQYGNQPSARDQAPIDYTARAKMADLGMTDMAQFQRMQGLATPVTPDRVAASEVGMDRPTQTWDTLKLREQQMMGTAGAAMGPQAQPTLNLAPYNPAAAQAAVDRYQQPDQTVAQNAVGDFLNAETFRRNEQDRLRQLAEAQQQSAVAQAQADTIRNSPTNIQAIIDAENMQRALGNTQTQAQTLGAKTELLKAEQGYNQAAVAASPVNEAVGRVVASLPTIGGSSRPLANEGVRAAVASFVSDAENIISQTAAMTPEQKNQVKSALKNAMLGMSFDEPSLAARAAQWANETARSVYTGVPASEQIRLRENLRQQFIAAVMKLRAFANSPA